MWDCSVLQAQSKCCTVPKAISPVSATAPAYPSRRRAMGTPTVLMDLMNLLTPVVSGFVLCPPFPLFSPHFGMGRRPFSDGQKLHWFELVHLDEADITSVWGWGLRFGFWSLWEAVILTSISFLIGYCCCFKLFPSSLRSCSISVLLYVHRDRMDYLGWTSSLCTHVCSLMSSPRSLLLLSKGLLAWTFKILYDYQKEKSNRAPV